MLILLPSHIFIKQHRKATGRNCSLKRMTSVGPREDMFEVPSVRVTTSSSPRAERRRSAVRRATWGDGDSDDSSESADEPTTRHRVHVHMQPIGADWRHRNDFSLASSPEGSDRGADTEGSAPALEEALNLALLEKEALARQLAAVRAAGAMAARDTTQQAASVADERDALRHTCDGLERECDALRTEVSARRDEVRQWRASAEAAAHAEHASRAEAADAVREVQKIARRCVFEARGALALGEDEAATRAAIDGIRGAAWLALTERHQSDTGVIRGRAAVGMGATAMISLFTKREQHICEFFSEAMNARVAFQRDIFAQEVAVREHLSSVAVQMIAACERDARTILVVEALAHHTQIWQSHTKAQRLVLDGQRTAAERAEREHRALVEASESDAFTELMRASASVGMCLQQALAAGLAASCARWEHEVSAACDREADVRHRADAEQERLHADWSAQVAALDARHYLERSKWADDTNNMKREAEMEATQHRLDMLAAEQRTAAAQREGAEAWHQAHEVRQALAAARGLHVAALVAVEDRVRAGVVDAWRDGLTTLQSFRSSALSSICLRQNDRRRVLAVAEDGALAAIAATAAAEAQSRAALVSTFAAGEGLLLRAEQRADDYCQEAFRGAEQAKAAAAAQVHFIAGQRASIEEALRRLDAQMTSDEAAHARQLEEARRAAANERARFDEIRSAEVAAATSELERLRQRISELEKGPERRQVSAQTDSAASPASPRPVGGTTAAGKFPAESEAPPAHWRSQLMVPSPSATIQQLLALRNKPQLTSPGPGSDSRAGSETPSEVAAELRYARREAREAKAQLQTCLDMLFEFDVAMTTLARRGVLGAPTHDVEPHPRLTVAVGSSPRRLSPVRAPSSPLQPVRGAGPGPSAHIDINASPQAHAPRYVGVNHTPSAVDRSLTAAQSPARSRFSGVALSPPRASRFVSPELPRSRTVFPLPAEHPSLSVLLPLRPSSPARPSPHIPAIKAVGARPPPPQTQHTATDHENTLDAVRRYVAAMPVTQPQPKAPAPEPRGIHPVVFDSLLAGYREELEDARRAAGQTATLAHTIAADVARRRVTSPAAESPQTSPRRASAQPFPQVPATRPPRFLPTAEF